MADLHRPTRELVDLGGLAGEPAPMSDFKVAEGNQAFQVLEGNRAVNTSLAGNIFHAARLAVRFYADRKARSVEDVSREAGVHRSVAFEHLERLVALGYLEVAHRRGLPGKPAKIYKLTGGPVQISHPMRRYDIVAESLGRAFDELGDIGSHAVRRAGRNFGESISLPGSKSPMAALEPMLEMGAEYETDRSGIIQCNNCLFAEVCRRAPVICRVHAGVLEGLFMHTELNVSVKALGFRDPYGCAYMLQENELGQELEAQAQ